MSLFGDMSAREVLMQFITPSEAVYKEDDIIGEDGLHYCRKCKEPKEIIKDYGEDFGEIRHAYPCKCRRDEKARREAYNLQIKQKQWKEDMRKKGLRYSEWIESTLNKDDGGEKQARAVVERYTDKWEEMLANNIGIIFTGSVGTGKSFYAAAIANAAINKLSQVYMISTSEVMERASGFEADAELNRILNYYDLVILDDLGAERNTSFGIEKIYNFIDRRYKANKPLIVTSNISLEQMEAETRPEYKRIYDRIKEMCNIPVYLVGTSRRTGISQDRAKLAQQILGAK